MFRYNAINAGAQEYEGIIYRDVSRLGELFNRYALEKQRVQDSDASETKHDIAVLMAQSAAIAYLLGKRRTLLEYDYLKSRRARYATFIESTGETPNRPLTIPKVKFKEAITDILSKEPRLAGSAEEIAQIYSTGRGFAMLRSLDTTITQKVQQVLAKSLEEGIKPGIAGDIIADLSGQTQAYATTVYRNNIGAAYTAGRFKQAADEDVSDIVAGMRVITANDSDVRPNHKAFSGFTARIDDPVWSEAAPLYGHNCRCRTRVVTTFELERNGEIKRGERLPDQSLPTDAKRDDGFVGHHPLLVNR